MTTENHARSLPSWQQCKFKRTIPWFPKNWQLPFVCQFPRFVIFQWSMEAEVFEGHKTHGENVSPKPRLRKSPANGVGRPMYFEGEVFLESAKKNMSMIGLHFRCMMCILVWEIHWHHFLEPTSREQMAISPDGHFCYFLCSRHPGCSICQLRNIYLAAMMSRKCLWHSMHARSSWFKEGYVIQSDSYGVLLGPLKIW